MTAPNLNRPTVPEVLDDFRDYYNFVGNNAWGSLHIVLDDGNYDRSSVQFCIDCAISKNDSEGERLARILLLMSKTQRKKIAEQGSVEYLVRIPLKVLK